MTQHIKPTIKVKSADDQPFELSVWPNIPGVTDNPVIQIDWDRVRATSSAAIEYRAEDAPAIAAAILKAAEESK